MVGVSDDPVGETYWKSKRDSPLPMPPDVKFLPDTRMWKVSSLLKNADTPLPRKRAEVLQSTVPAEQ